MAFRNITLIAVATLSVGLAGQSSAQDPGLLLTNGNILTLDENDTVVNSVVVRLGRIVAVGNDNTTHHVPFIIQIGKIGDDKIDPQHIILGEHQAGIDNHNVVVIFEYGHIFADFPQATQGDNPQFLFTQLLKLHAHGQCFQIICSA